MIKTTNKEIIKIIEKFVGIGTSDEINKSPFPPGLKGYHPARGHMVETTLGIDGNTDDTNYPHQGEAYVRMKLLGGNWALDAYLIFQSLKFYRKDETSLEAIYKPSNGIVTIKKTIDEDNYEYTLIKAQMISGTYKDNNGNERLKQTEKLTWKMVVNDVRKKDVDTYWHWVDYKDGR